MERAGIVGEVVVTALNLDGTIAHQERHNLVVTTGKTVLCKLLGGDAGYAGLEEVDSIGFGTDATAVAAGQTALLAQEFAKAVTVSYPAANQVQFETTMLVNEGGAFVYRELGLLTKTTDILVSRVVIGAITKSTSVQIHVVWTLSIT